MKLIFEITPTTFENQEKDNIMQSKVKRNLRVTCGHDMRKVSR